MTYWFRILDYAENTGMIMIKEMPAIGSWSARKGVPGKNSVGKSVLADLEASSSEADET